MSLEDYLNSKYGGMSLIRVVLESPYKGDIEKNLRYLKAAVLDCFRRGEAPFASHGLYPGALDDAVPAERMLGILAGFEWGFWAKKAVVYTDLGVSEGMSKAIAHWTDLGLPVETRSLPEWVGR